AAHPFDRNADAKSPHQTKVVVDRNNCALYFSRSAIPYSAEPSRVRYLRHQGIYGFRRDALLRFVQWKSSPLERAESLEQLRALENSVRIHVLITKTGSPGVDTPEDAVSLEEALASSSRERTRR